MAARYVGLCQGAALRTRGLARLRIHERWSTSSPGAPQKDQQDVENVSQEDGPYPLSAQGVTMVPPRDRFAVLKALSSTVGKLEHPLVMGRSPADPLAPRSRQEQMEFTMATAAGERAAKYVIDRWPKLFEARKPEPDWTAKRKMKGCREETVQFLVEKRRVQKAVKMYKALQEKGKPVSLEVQNNLLHLLGYYGMGTPWRKMADENRNSKGKDVDVASEDVLAPEPQEEMAGDVLESRLTAGGEGTVETEQPLKAGIFPKTGSPRTGWQESTMERVWSLDNWAEKFLAEMEQTDEGTYDAMIPGLVKFKAYDRAFETFEMMRSKGFQATRRGYNCLLEALTHSKEPQLWRRAKGLLNEMAKSPTVIPDTRTFNLLLQIAKKSLPSSKETSSEISEEMLHLGIKPNLSTFTLILQSHTDAGDASILYDITTYLESNRDVLTIDDPQDIYFFPVAISVVRYLKDYKLGMRLKALAETDNWYLTQNIGYFLNHYLVLLSYAPNLNVLMDAYKSVVPHVYLPRDWVYGDMFEACREKQAPDVALDLFYDIEKRRVRINDVRVFKKLFNALSVKLNLEQLPEYIAALDRILASLVNAGFKPAPFMVNQMVRICALGDNIEKATEYFSLFETYGIQPQFMALLYLLEAHVAAGNLEEFKSCLKIMLHHRYTMDYVKVKGMLAKFHLPRKDSDDILGWLRSSEVPKSSTEEPVTPQQES